MFCPKCGSQIADGAAFCPKCGAQLAQRIQKPAPAGQQAAAAATAKPKAAARLPVQAIVALVCAALVALSAFLPWVESDANTQQLSSLASSMGMGAQFQDSYTLAEFSDLADDYQSYERLEANVNSLGSALGMRGDYSTSTTSNAANLFNGIHGFWILALVLLVAGAILYLVRRNKALLVAGLAVSLGLALVVMYVVGEGTSDLSLSVTGPMLAIVASVAGLVSIGLAKGKRATRPAKA